MLLLLELLRWSQFMEDADVADPDFWLVFCLPAFFRELGQGQALVEALRGWRLIVLGRFHLLLVDCAWHRGHLEAGQGRRLDATDSNSGAQPGYVHYLGGYPADWRHLDDAVCCFLISMVEVCWHWGPVIWGWVTRKRGFIEAESGGLTFMRGKAPAVLRPPSQPPTRIMEKNRGPRFLRTIAF